MTQMSEPRLLYAARRAHDLMAKALVPSSRRFLPPHPRFAVIPTDYLGVSIIGNGVYERREIELLRGLIRARGLSTSVFLDIGANIGNHCVSLGHEFSQVIAFEPNPPIASLLRTNIMLAGAGNVRVHEFGLGRDDAELTFGLLEAGNDGSGSFVSGGSGLTLPVRNGDAFMASHEPEIASGGCRIGFVKCDVEGFEAEVFAGLRATLAAHRPILTFESNTAEAGGRAFEQLRAAGYTHLSAIRETGDRKSWAMQELTRVVSGYRCWLEPIDVIPERRTNLVASFEPLN
jgi:FkbM family methyltransferase